MQRVRMSKCIAVPAVMLTVLGTVANVGHAVDACLPADGQSSAAGILLSENGAYILAIGSPVCLKGEEDLDNVAATTRLQVFPGTEPVQGALASLVGKTVTIKGSFHGSRSKKFNAPILVDVSEAAPQ